LADTGRYVPASAQHRFPGQLPIFPSPATDEEKKKKAAKDKADRERQAAAAEQQRLANTLLDQQLRAADRVFQHQIELDRQRYELQKRLDDAQAQNRILRETGAARDIVSNFEDLQRSLREIEERRVRAAQDVRLAKQTQQSAAVRATFDAQGAAMLRGTTGVIARTGSTGQSTGPHLDARWADGRRITAADADRYLSVNGRTPSSYGVTSPYGPRSLFGRNFHAGIDFGTPSGSGITLKNGATLLRDLGFTGAGGYAVEINTKDGPMRLLHLQRGSARMPTGAAAQQNRAIRASGGAVIEGLDVTQAEAQQQLIEANVSKERAALFEQFTLKATDALRQQNATMRDSNELQTLRNRLTLEGVRPEFIDLEERLLGLRKEQSQEQTTYNQLVKDNPDRKDELQRALAAQNEQYAERARLLRENAEAAEAFNKAMRTRQDDRIGLGLREGAEAYVQSIGTMREATTQLAQTGIKGVEDAIFSLVTTGTANFQEFAASILRDTARMIIQQLILRSIMQIIGAVAPGGGSFGKGYFDPITGKGAAGPNFGFAMGGAFAKNGIVPFAMGGIVNKPTLFKFANGGAGRLGLMGEAGPEAIMPLRRLPSGRLGVESAGSGGNSVQVDNITINVENSGEQLSPAAQKQIAGQVRGIVLATLVDQRRGGGVLR
jgi:lambda family phage tail tape measure protein